MLVWIGRWFFSVWTMNALKIFKQIINDIIIFVCVESQKL